MIYHLVPQSYHNSQSALAPYYSETLGEEGFIHCTADPTLLLDVANLYFTDLVEPLLVYTINEIKLTSPVKYEPPTPVVGADVTAAKIAAAETADTENTYHATPDILFPHIYGPINREAIINIEALVLNEESQWEWDQRRSS